MNKLKFIVPLALFFVIAGAVTYKISTSKNPKTIVSKKPSQQKQVDTKPQQPTRIRMIAAGDFIAHDSVNLAANKSDGGYDYLPLMSDFLPIFKQADVRFCNDPILNGGESLGISGYPKFNSPTAFVTDMGKLGCNLVNTASNHSFDFAQANIDKSVEAWEGVPNLLAVSGQNRTQAEHDNIKYFTVNGVKFAFLAYTTYSNAPPANQFGVNVFSQEFAATQVATAKQNGAQIIVASMRWGTEYSPQVNATQTNNSQFLADLGVSLVLGHGPHVLQPVAKLTGKGGNTTTVWYSLGNFLNSQIPAESLFNGLAVIDFDIKTLAISNMQYLPIYMHYEWTAAQAASENLATRKNLHLYLLENATQAMLDSQQLKTTIQAQKTRIEATLKSKDVNVPLITSTQLSN